MVKQYARQAYPHPLTFQKPVGMMSLSGVEKDINPKQIALESLLRRVGEYDVDFIPIHLQKPNCDDTGLTPTAHNESMPEALPVLDPTTTMSSQSNQVPLEKLPSQAPLVLRRRES